MQYRHIITCLFAATLLGACTNDDVLLTPVESSGTAYGTLPTGYEDPATFTIDMTPVTETEEIPTDATASNYEDFSENWLYDVAAEGDEVKEVTITYSNSGAVVSGETQNLDITNVDGHVTISATKKRIYRLTGTCSDGSFKIYSDKKFGIILDGVNLTNRSGAVINIQKGPTFPYEKKRCYLMIATGTSNALTDCTTYTSTPEDEDEKGCIFSEGKILIGQTTNTNSGDITTPGTLVIYANGKNGIASDDYVYMHKYSNVKISALGGNGIKTNDGLYIGGGVLGIQVDAEGCKGVNTEGEMAVSGGRTQIINTASASTTDDDVSYAACVKSETLINITGGELFMRSKEGAGSVAMISKGNLNITGGVVLGYSYSGPINVSGTAYIDDKNAKVYIYSEK